MSNPYRDGAVLRLWECDRVVLDLDKITMCLWDTDMEDTAKQMLRVFFIGDGEELELNLDEANSFLTAWRTFRRA